MPCFHPLLACRDGYNESGKPHYGIYRMDETALKNFPPEDVKQIPCGKCIGCRLQHGQDWSNRMLMESLCHPSDTNWFVTLTYDDEHVPKVLYEEDGSLVVLESLRKKDLSDFNKNLKNWLRQYKKEKGITDPNFEKFRFFGIGEYGTETFRPHMHIIYFGLPVPDVIAKPGTAPNEFGDQILYSGVLEKIWRKGFVELGSVTPRSTGYVGRYALKKVHGDQAADYESRGQEPEWSNMSRRPGIGREYFDKYPQMFDNISCRLPTESGSVNVFPSRYFRKLIDTPETKVNRYVAGKINREQKLKKTDVSYINNLEIQEIDKKQKTSILNKREIKK